MTNIFATHSALVARREASAPVPACRVYGYQTVGYNDANVRTITLFAVTHDGRAFKRKTSSDKWFNSTRAKWSAIDAAHVPAVAEFVGTYLDDCLRQS